MNGNLILQAIQAAGPIGGILVFFTALAIGWGFHGLLRQVSIRQNRFALFLIDKRVGTLEEMYRYGLLQEIGGAMEDFALIAKGIR